MMNRKFFIATMMLLGACSQNNVNLCGLYQGTLPSADTAGIETMLVLQPQNNYTKIERYADKDHSTFTEQGKFTYTDNIISLKDNQDGHTSYYRKEGKNLRMLGKNQEFIEGDLSELYILRKTTIKK